MTDDHGLAAMTVHDENGVYRSGMRERRIQRRKQLGVAVAGLAVFGAAGLFVVQGIQLAQNTVALEPPVVVTPSQSPAPSSAPAPSRTKARTGPAGPGKPNRSGARQETSPTPTPTPTPTPSPSASGMAVAEVINRHDEPATGGTIRVTSAGFDLTGEPELALAGDDGWAVGRARCTRTVRNEPGARPRVVPSTLVCWRVSPRRSVVTVAITSQGRPSSGETVAALEREWARLN
ncbi:hypothetical protein Aab01nite_30580 [Paractinoplanes abujensis]|uniref:Uncharacterized protein n=1 Tax=Paractinoplanes abujensis TaxID=882441 RepID=A0A7W7G6I3_9ACTN|nr:hypothetical protein [Actinoplanes abujensis]MBB4698047.1 hypothetical protein [Actinoplanes abujensis]GID19468.1 hypothetical protein Aab01nite_30580 [Actinoplanes abujensis]